jgi:hypothetical protein
LPTHLQLQLDAFENIHVVHTQQHRLALELRRQLALPPDGVAPAEPAEQALRVDACGMGQNGGRADSCQQAGARAHAGLVEGVDVSLCAAATS